MQVSPRAIDLIVSFEVGSRAGYEMNWKYPTWPGGASGITIGIGYDLGYCARAKCFADWKPHMSGAEAKVLASVVGLRGQEANIALGSVRSVAISWDSATKVLRERSLPSYSAATARAFPDSTKLPPDCFGALVSLVYNRGASMTGDRRRELRDIRSAIAAGKPQLVPGLIRAMKRIWVGATIEQGMARRREAEARLFEDGLSL